MRSWPKCERFSAIAEERQNEGINKRIFFIIRQMPRNRLPSFCHRRIQRGNNFWFHKILYYKTYPSHTVPYPDSFKGTFTSRHSLSASLTGACTGETFFKISVSFLFAHCVWWRRAAFLWESELLQNIDVRRSFCDVCVGIVCGVWLCITGTGRGSDIPLSIRCSS